MAKIPYHEAKDIIEAKVNAYRSQFDQDLPEITFENIPHRTVVKFELMNAPNFYNIINSFVSRMGKGNIEDSYGLEVKYDGLRIAFYQDPFSQHIFIYKDNDDFSTGEIDAIIDAYHNGNQAEKRHSPIEALQGLGVSVYDSSKELSWDDIAGYDRVKKEISDTILLPLQHPEIYDEIARGTRKKLESIKPKAVLFEGPPGTGKTTSARIIAAQSGFPMAYVPIESIMTKWFGESERRLSKIFDTCNELGQSLIFLDEIDSLAGSREKDMHEATRKILSVLLRKIDGFDQYDKSIIIGATNRKQDLDAALIDRFDTSIYFGLPNMKERQAIFSNYAKQLEASDLEKLALKSGNISGRSIKDVCEHAERGWASKRLKGAAEGLPNVFEYLRSLDNQSSR